MNSLKSRLNELSSRSPIMNIRHLFYSLAHGDDEDYEQFQNRSEDIVTFRSNHPQFHVCRVHVKIGSYIASGLGLTLTICFCIFYSLYHSRGQGRNAFVDSIELIDLILAFLIGIPCHILLAIGIYQERKKYKIKEKKESLRDNELRNFFGPFLVFYATNFILNVLFTFLTITAVSFDFHRQLFGNIRLDLSWTLFQILWTSAQGLAIYVVFKCRRYINALNHYKNNSFQENGDVHRDII